MFTLAAPICLGLSLLLALLLLLPAGPAQAEGPDSGYAVVVFPGEEATVRPISFTSGISRIGALKLAGWTVESSGNAVCSIDGVGCPATNCFCADNWWSSAEWSNGWDTLSPLTTTVENDDIIGFRWSNTSWGPPALPGPAYAAASRAIDWLAAQKQPNGSYGDENNTAEAVMAFGANRQADKYGGVGYLLGVGPAFSAEAPHASAKVASALAAAESCWPAGAILPTDYYSATTGAYGDASLNSAGRHAWAMLGVKAISQSLPANTADFLKSKFIDRPAGGGGWKWQDNFTLDTNSTALAVQALVAAGEPVSTSTEISKALTYFKAAQNTDGGFAYDPDSTFSTASDANSTAYIVQALIAVGEDPLGSAWTTISGTTPISYLLSNQLSDGSLEFQTGQGFSNQLATQQAIPVLLGRSLPVNVAELPACLRAFLPLIAKE